MTEQEGPTSPSYQNFKRGQQLYAVIEFCNSPEALWGKLCSGKWDWLGVRRKGNRETFVLGRPPVGRLEAFGSVTMSETGSTGTHRVTVEIPLRPPLAPSVHNFATAERARAYFRSQAEKLSEPDGSSGLYRLRLYVDDVLEGEEFVVRRTPNLYGGRAD